MFRPSENANELFRRLNNDQFDFRVSPDKIEKLPFGASIEVQAKCSDMTEVTIEVQTNIGLNTDNCCTFIVVCTW